MNTIMILDHAKSQGFKAKRDGKTIVVNQPDEEIYFRIKNHPSYYLVDGWIGEQKLKERCHSEWDIIDLLKQI